MIRLVQRKLIIPRGDTGSFSIPVLPNTNSGDIAVFSILNPLKHERLFDKEIKEFDSSLQIRFTHEETVNLPAGQYNWDIKLYRNPVIENNILISGEEIDSYYAAFSLPICEIRETGDNYIVSPDAPNSYLRPDQIEIITGAITALNAAVEKTEQNVEHYPKIIDEQWYTWDAENGEYVATGVSANGNTGNGIESAILNNDYTLTLNFTDGTSYTTTSIRGAVGNGIEDIVLNNDYTLTIIYSDGNSYTTPSIRGPIGPTPRFSIGTVQEGATAAATITGTAENPILNLTLSNAKVPTRVSQLENDSGYLSAETDPTVPAWAKAANKPAYTAAEVGAPTVAEMNTAIGEAIGQINSFDMAVVQTLPTQDISTHTIYLVPKTGETNDVYDEYVYINNAWEMIGNTQIDLSDYALKSELPTKVSDLTDDSGHYTKPANGIPASDLADGVIPTVPVQDVQINGASVIQNGIANIPIAGMKLGAVRVAATSGIDINSSYGILSLSQTTDAMIKAGTSIYAISPKTQHAAAFYGLAKAAGDTTQAASDNAVGTYTDEAKAAIQTMLGVPDVSDIPSVPVRDVKISTTSILSNGVATIPIAHTGRYGAVKAATDVEAKAGAASGIVVSTWGQHASTFYGLAKAAGDITQSASNNAVGSYTSEAKAAIQNMLSVPSSTDFNTLASALGTEYEDLTFPLSTPTYCVHNNELYLLRAPITSQKEWDSNDWIKTNVGNTLKNLTEQTTNTETSINQVLNQLAPFEYNPPTSTRNYNVNDLFTYDGKLYQATTQINIGDTITPNTNCKTTKVSKSFVRDVQIDNTSILNNGIANIPLNDYVTKVSLDNAGISNKTYTTLMDASITTVDDGIHISPYTTYAGVTLSEWYTYRVTFNGTEYEVDISGWYEDSVDANGRKGYECIGNVLLYDDTATGLFYNYLDLPFCILYNYERFSGIQILTPEAGTYSLKIERVNYTQKQLPNTLIYGNSEASIFKKNVNNSTYLSASIGQNATTKRGTMAFGFDNRTDGEFDVGIGYNNRTSGNFSIGIGYGNRISNNFSVGIGNKNVTNGANSFALGVNNTASDASSFAIGDTTTANGSNMFAIGKKNVPANKNFSNWATNTYYKKGDIVIADYYAATNLVWLCLKSHTSVSTSFIDDGGTENWTLSPSNGDTLFVIGNGSNLSPNGSNALKIDLVGNSYYNGDVYVNCNSDSTGGIKLAALSDVQVNGVSIISNGVANIPYASSSQVGVVKKGYALYMGNDGTLNVNLVSDATVKAGTGGEAICTVSRQHIATFYGLAKAAGADEKNSTLPLGTYSDNAKAAIKNMIGVESDVTTIEVSETAPTINGIANTRYLCGEVTSISITPPAYGICDVRFTSGSTVTILTLPSTVKMPAWFDATALEANTIYEINIVDGVYGTVATWQL